MPLIHFRDGGNVFIKFGAATGSENLAMGTQQVMRGSGIPIHRRLEMEEASYVLKGGGTVLLDETCSASGEQPKQLTREQIRAIARKHATEFR